MRTQIAISVALLQLQSCLAAPSPMANDASVESIIKGLNLTSEPLRACPMIARRGLTMKGCPQEIEKLQDPDLASDSVVHKRSPISEDSGIRISPASGGVVISHGGTSSTISAKGHATHTASHKGGAIVKKPHGSANSSATTTASSRHTGINSILKDCNLYGMDEQLPKRCIEEMEPMLTLEDEGNSGDKSTDSTTTDRARRSTLAECEQMAREGTELPKRCFLGVGPVVINKTQISESTASSPTSSSKRSRVSGLASIFKDCNDLFSRGEELPRRCFHLGVGPVIAGGGYNEDAVSSTTTSSKRSLTSGLASIFKDCHVLASRGKELPKRCFLGLGPEIASSADEGAASSTASSKRSTISGLSSILDDCAKLIRRGEELPRRCLEFYDTAPVSIKGPAIADKASSVASGKRSLFLHLPEVGQGLHLGHGPVVFPRVVSKITASSTASMRGSAVSSSPKMRESHKLDALCDKKSRRGGVITRDCGLPSPNNIFWEEDII